MSSRIANRLAQLQQEQQQTQQALAHLEQQRQGLLQQLIGQQYALEVLQGLLDATPLEGIETSSNDHDRTWTPVAP